MSHLGGMHNWLWQSYKSFDKLPLRKRTKGNKSKTACSAATSSNQLAAINRQQRWIYSWKEQQRPEHSTLSKLVKQAVRMPWATRLPLNPSRLFVFADKGGRREQLLVSFEFADKGGRQQQLVDVCVAVVAVVATGGHSEYFNAIFGLTRQH